jgi:hypothetical protein
MFSGCLYWAIVERSGRGGIAGQLHRMMWDAIRTRWNQNGSEAGGSRGV